MASRASSAAAVSPSAVASSQRSNQPQDTAPVTLAFTW
jgi:hypothetical protein